VSTEIRISFSGASFAVSDLAFQAAQLYANDTRSVQYIGLTPSGTEMLGFTREELLAQGADRIAWIMPERAGAA